MDSSANNNNSPSLVAGRGLSKRKNNKERGQGMAEYIIIVILVAIIVLIGVKLFGKSIINQFNNATGEIDELQGT